MSDGVHQVAASAAPRDAITHHMLQARAVLRGLGLRSEIFVDPEHLHPGLAGDVLAAGRWEEVARPSDAAILHYSIASPAIFHVVDRCPRCAIHYHNITPAELLWRFAPRIALECAVGRRRLRELAGRVVAVAADSGYNGTELERLGFGEATVLGVMRAPLPAVARRERAPGETTRILFVGRGVPNKAQHHLVMASAALTDAGIDHRIDLVGSWPAPDYERYCAALAETLGAGDRIHVAGPVEDGELAQRYADADVFLCLSDHEGFCVPLIEAMDAGAPIVAFASSAVPETLEDAGLLLGEKPPSLVAEAVAETLSNHDLRARMSAGRARRLEAMAPAALAGRLARFVDAIP